MDAFVFNIRLNIDSFINYRVVEMLQKCVMTNREVDVYIKIHTEMYEREFPWIRNVSLM